MYSGFFYIVGGAPHKGSEEHQRGREKTGKLHMFTDLPLNTELHFA
jgi:hypothetical protein